MAADNDFNRLMGCLRRGDEDAASEVFHRFAQRLIALARSQLDSWIRTRVEPEDAIQSVFRSFFTRSRTERTVGRTLERRRRMLIRLQSDGED